MKIRAYTILISLVLIISALVIGLRGTSPHATAYQVSGLQTATSIQGVGLGATLWSDNFTANLRAQTFLVNGQAPVPGSVINHLWFYVEATTGTTGTFSMKVTSIQIFSLYKTAPGSNEISGNLQGIVINLNLPSVNLS